jgi:hypothetical protein
MNDGLKRMLKEAAVSYYKTRTCLTPLGTADTTRLLHQPQMIDDSDCGAIGGINIGRGNRSTLSKPTLAPLCLPQIPHDKTRTRTRVTAVGSQGLFV